MVPQIGNSFVCGVTRLGLNQSDIKSFLYIPDANIYYEKPSYIRKIDNSHVLEISNDSNNITTFTVYNVDSSGMNVVYKYTAQTNCFSDCWIYSLQNVYLLSGLNYMLTCSNNYTINQNYQINNNPYVELLVCKYKSGMNYFYEYFSFVKTTPTQYGIMKIKDTYSLYDHSNIVYFYNYAQVNGNNITEDNINYVTAFNEKNLYCFKSTSTQNYYYMIERPDTTNRTTRFRNEYFCELSRRYRYDIIQYDNNGNFTTLYSSNENTIYYILQEDYTGTIYLIMIQVYSNTYQVTYYDIESMNTINSYTINRPSGFKLVAVTNIRNEIIILEVTDYVQDYTAGVNVLLTNVSLNSSGNIEAYQSQLPINLYCTLTSSGDDTIGTDIKGISFYDTEISFAVYCGSNRYDANYVIISVPEKDKFFVSSKREPFTFSFINHPVCYYHSGYIKTGLFKSYYPLAFPQTSVIFETTTDVNDINRISTYATIPYFSSYRQSLKRVHDTVYIGDLSIGLNLDNNKYIIPLQEGTDTFDKLSNFNQFIQSYVVAYSPQITSVLYYMKYSTRIPMMVGFRDLLSKEISLYRINALPLFIAKSLEEIIYIIGVSIKRGNGENVDITQKTYLRACSNISDLQNNFTIFVTTTELLQKEIIYEVNISDFKSNGNSIFDNESQFFGLHATENGEIIVFKQTNPNAGIPISYDGSGVCKYYYTFDIYYGFNIGNLNYYGTINYSSATPIILYKYDENSNTITYTSPILCDLNNTLYLYFFENVIDLNKTLWYSFEEIYGSF